jgi:hypothetical protein
MRWVAPAGALLVIVSVVFEFARMKPSTQYLVDPWSIRGYEMTLGGLYAAVGVALLIGILLVAWQRSEETTIGTAIVAYLGLAAVAIVAVFARDDVVDPATGEFVRDASGEIAQEAATVTFTVSDFYAILISFLIAMILTRLLKGPLTEHEGLKRRFGTIYVFAGLLIFVLSFVVAFFAIKLLIGGDEISLLAWVAILIIAILLATLALVTKPRQLASNRMLIYATLLSAAAVGFVGGAMRSTLIRVQAETFEAGVEAGLEADLLFSPGRYQDTQVTSGYFLANIGILLVFIGAVGMWAKRRDHILNVQRADRQRQAAQLSAAEIQAAIDAANANKNLPVEA